MSVHLKSSHYFTPVIVKEIETRILSILNFQKTTRVKNLRFILKQSKQVLYSQKTMVHSTI